MKLKKTTKKHILITGVAGNIGSALAAKLCARGNCQIVGVDNLSTGKRSKLPTNSSSCFRFIKADVNKYNEILPIFCAQPFDYVFHYAAVVGVRRTLENPLMVLNDIEGIKNILELCKNCGISRVFYSSSSEVYGEPVSLPQSEDTTPLNSRLPYAVVKNLGEAYLKSYHQEHGLPFTIFRIFNTYGPMQSDEFVLPRFLNAALTNSPITIYGDGMQTRTFCYIDDNVDAVLGCLDQNRYVNDILNIGSDVEIKIIELASLIIKMTNSNSKIQHLPPLPDGDMTRRRPDIARMTAVLNRPLIDVRDGIRRLIKLKRSL